MKKHFKTVAAALLAATALTPAAWAQNATSLDEIRVTADGEKTTPGDFVIGAEQLNFNAPSQSSEIFAGESAVSGAGVIATGAKVYVHGLEEKTLNVTVDGVRQGGGGWHHDGNLLLDPELLKAVTVKPGVAAADDGPAALGGAIQYETKDARDLLSSEQALGGYAKLEWRSNGDWFKETGAVYGQQNGMEFLLYGSLHDGDDYEDGNGVLSENSGPDNYALLGKFAINAANGHRFETSFENTADTGERDFRNNFTPIGAPPFAPNAVVPYDKTRSTFTLSFTDETADELITPSAQFGYNRSTLKSDATADPSGSLILSAIQTSYSGKVNGDVKLGAGVLSLGVDFHHDKAEGDSASTVGGGADFAPLYESRRNVGGYAQARLKPMPMVDLSLGGRFDQQWFRGARGEKLDDNGFSGNATLEFSPVSWATLSAGYSHVWGGFEFAETALLGFFNGSPNYAIFQPSVSDSFRVGGEVEFDGFSAGLHFFHTTIEDLYDRSNATAFSDVETQGFDAKIGYRRAEGFATLKYTYTDVEENGVHPSANNYYKIAAGGHLVALQAGYQPLPGLVVGADAEFAPEYDGYQSVGGAVLPGYEVLNLFVAYDVPQIPGLSLRADFDNVLDECYFRHTADGAGSSNSAPTYEPGRSFGLTGKVVF